MLEKELEKKEEEERRKKLLMGNVKEDDRESDLPPKEWPKHLPPKIYKSRTDFMISKLEAGGMKDGIDREDHILQLPWTPE